MEERKEKEIEYYDKRAENWLKDNPDKIHEGDFEGFNPLVLDSLKFCYSWLGDHCQDKKSFRLWLRKRNSFNFPSEIRSRKSNRN